MDKRAGLLASTAALLIAVVGCGSGNVDFVPRPGTSPTLSPLAVSPASLTFNAGTSSTQSLTVTDTLFVPYTASGCSGIVSTSIAATLNVTAVAGGSCTLTISDVDGRSVGVPISVTAVGVPVQ